MTQCNKCGQNYEPGKEPDPCLGLLPGVANACCGHGGQPGPGVQEMAHNSAYILFENGVSIRPGKDGGFEVDIQDWRKDLWNKKNELTRKRENDKI